MKIIADENITFAEEAFSEFGQVDLINGRNITNSILKNVDALIVRSITSVNKELLKGTNVKLVGTATIGTDHIDMEYLNNNNIYFSSAQGCNSHAVKEYVFTALSKLVYRKGLHFNDLTFGVIGIGNIGSKVSGLGEVLGMNVLKNDPPLKRKFDYKDFYRLEDLMESDVITLHVPLNKEGVDKTQHLFDKEKLNKLKDGAIIINSSRGSVLDSKALLELAKKKQFTLIMDVWENEPSINIKLMEKSFLASPHIAGYSLEGKVNGTKMIYDAFCNFLNVENKWKPQMPEIQDEDLEINISNSKEEITDKLFNRIYNINNDDETMREMIKIDKKERSKYFDQLRKRYPYRREFSNYKIKLNKPDKEIRKILEEFRFMVKEN